MNPKVEWILKRPKYQRLLMLLGIMLIIAAIFVYLVYLPMQDDLSRLNKQSADLERKLVNDRRIAANLPVFKAEYEKMQLQLEEALTQLPNDKEIPKLLTSIASTAKENGLNVLYFKPGGETPRGFYAEVPVSLKLVGSFHQVAKFFYDVSSLPRIVNLSNVDLGGAKDEGGRLMLNISTLATTFRFLDKAEQQAAQTQAAGR
jgi:type IV pilus assembly protein PilO